MQRSRRSAPTAHERVDRRRRRRAGWGALVAALVCGAIAAPAATAVPGYVWVGEFGSAGSGDGELAAPGDAAVTADGHVLVADRDNDRVQVFAPTPTGAEYVSQFGAGVLDGPTSVAVDRVTGAVYVSDASQVVKFDSSYAQDLTFAPLAAHGSLAVDPASHDIVVLDDVTSLVRRFSATGTPGSATAGRLGTFQRGTPLTVEGDGAILTSTASGVERYTASMSYVQTFRDTNQPGPLAVNDDGQPLVGDSNHSYDTSVPPSVRMFAPKSIDAVRNMPLPSNTIWSLVTGVAVGPGEHGRLYVVTDQDRGFGRVAVQVFDAIQPVAPVVGAEPGPTDVTATSAVLGATVNPGNAPTTYRFEWGTDTSYGHATVTRGAGSGEDDAQVSDLLDGLQPLTTYHYRVVVDNGVGGEVAGDDQTFTTADPPPTVGGVAVHDVATTSATLSATVDTHGYTGTYAFVVRATNGTYARTIGPLDLAAADGGRTVTATFPSLPAGGDFTVHLNVHTVGGDVSTAPVSFTTPARPRYVPPPPEQRPETPYGCSAPAIVAPGGTVRAGQHITITGSDLGAFGTVSVGFARADVDAYATNGVAITVPTVAAGTYPVRVDCGVASNVVPLRVVGPEPSNAFTVARSVRGASATLRVRVPGPGVVRVSGTSVATRSVTARGAGAVDVVARLTKAGRARLAKSARGRLARTLRVRFTPTGGRAASRTVTVTYQRGATR
jgi:hypothetical protein